MAPYFDKVYDNMVTLHIHHCLFKITLIFTYLVYGGIGIPDGWFLWMSGHQNAKDEVWDINKLESL